MVIVGIFPVLTQMFIISQVFNYPMCNISLDGRMRIFCDLVIESMSFICLVQSHYDMRKQISH